MMKYTTILLAFLFVGAGILKAQHTATGTVYNDLNENNIQEQGEPGIASVAVSNGRDVVLTDKQGRYELQVDDDDILFVIKPSGFDLPLNERNLPQFYYIHKPNGSPDLEFNGVEPTGPLPETVNFPLLKSGEEKEFKILVFGDPQPYNRREVDYFDRDIVSELAGVEGYELGISLGDLVGDDLDLFDPYTRSVQRVGIPWFNVYGNHDMNYDAEHDHLADETFESTFGPATYSFNQGNVHFIILDDVVYPRPDGESGYIGGLTDEQLTFIENDLNHVTTDHLVVLAFHIPIMVPDGSHTFRLKDRDRLFELLENHPHSLSLSAHTHIQQFGFFGDEHNWKHEKPHIHYNVGTTSGDWWSGVPDERNIPPTLMRDGTPNGYATLNFNGNQFTLDYQAANYDKSYKMSIWGPEVVPQDSWHGAELYVNYFLGSSRTRVEYRVANQNSEWQPMNKVKEGDPNVARLRQKWDQAETVLAGRRPSNPIKSTHLWSAGVPNNLPLGKQTIEVRVTDMFGRQFHDTFEYEVVKPGGLGIKN